MNYERLAINDFKNRMRSCVFWNRRIIELNEEIENINYKLDGTSAVEFKFDNIKYESTVREKHMRKIALYDRQNELMKEIEKYEGYFYELEKQFNQLDEEMQNIVFSIYVLQFDMSGIAEKMYLATTTLRNRVDQAVKEVVI